MLYFYIFFSCPPDGIPCPQKRSDGAGKTWEYVIDVRQRRGIRVRSASYPRLQTTLTLILLMTTIVVFNLFY